MSRMVSPVGLGELFDAGGHVDGVPDEGELQLAAPADGSGDHHVGAEGCVESSPFGQTRLHAVERGGQGTEVVVLDDGQALVVVPSRDPLCSPGQVANRL